MITHAHAILEKALFVIGLVLTLTGCSESDEQVDISEQLYITGEIERPQPTVILNSMKLSFEVTRESGTKVNIFISEYDGIDESGPFYLEKIFSETTSQKFSCEVDASYTEIRCNNGVKDSTMNIAPIVKELPEKFYFISEVHKSDGTKGLSASAGIILE